MGACQSTPDGINRDTAADLEEDLERIQARPKPPPVAPGVDIDPVITAEIHVKPLGFEVELQIRLGMSMAELRGTIFTAIQEQLPPEATVQDLRAITYGPSELNDNSHTLAHCGAEDGAVLSILMNMDAIEEKQHQVRFTTLPSPRHRAVRVLTTDGTTVGLFVSLITV